MWRCDSSRPDHNSRILPFRVITDGDRRVESEDAASPLSNTVNLDLAGDSDNTAMVHVYNFEKSPATDTMPAAADGSTVPVAPLAADLLVSVLAGAYALRRRAA